MPPSNMAVTITVFTTTTAPDIRTYRPGYGFNTTKRHALLTAQTLLEHAEPGLFSEQLATLKRRHCARYDKPG